jgi:peptide/nickel transport system substrate-binding protein
MMETSYWNRTASRRLTRRRALIAAGGGAFGAAFLAACGGDDDDSPPSTGPGTGATGTGGTGAATTGGTGGTGTTGPEQTGLLYTPVDTTSSAVKGGVMTGAFAQEPIHYDPLSASSQFVFNHAHHAYQRFFSLKGGTIDEPATGEAEGDAVSSWEFSPDSLKLTMKIRPNTMWDARPPTSSRVMNSEDVKWSWDRFIELQPGSRFFANSLNPDAPVANVSYPDAQTVVMDLAFPSGPLLKMLGTIYYFAILPIEAESAFDIRQEMRGSGAWMMTKYEPSLGWEYRRNPNWYRANERPFLDGIDYVLLPDLTSGGPQTLAQFEAKRLWSLGLVPPTGVQPADLVLPLKNDTPDLQMIANTPLRGQGSINYIGMSKLPESKWEQDIRLRQALSMVLDRDAYIDAFYNVSGFEAEGLPMETGHNSHVPCSWPSIWLDPKEDELGANSKYLQFQPEEAAALLNAAGAFGTEDTITFAATGQFGTPPQIDVLVQMMNEGGHFKITQNPQDYTTIITPQYTFGKGQYPDLGTHPLGGWVDWEIPLWNTFSPGGRNDYVGHETPHLQEIMVRYRNELDPEARVEIAKEWQIAIAEEMVLVPFPGQATGFGFAYPWFGNAGYFETAGGGVAPQETLIHAWYDQSKDNRPS